MNDKIEVSIICNAYNHEKYIKKCLDGLVNQITNFRYEILVNDDASFDETPNIIRKYEAKYPLLVKPIYQKNNQYSQGISIFDNYQYPRVKGKYIALCEGDDYWIDMHKLQRQYNALEENVNIDICSCGAKVYLKGKKIGEICPRRKDCIIPVEDVILGGGEFVSTNSLMFRTNLFNNIPMFRKEYQIDYTLQILGSLRGGMYYINDIMCIYNFMTNGSWTRIMNKDKSKVINIYKKIENMLNTLNKETDYKYNSAISKRIMKNNFALIRRFGPYDDLKKGNNLDIYKELPLIEKLKINLKIIFKKNG